VLKHMDKMPPEPSLPWANQSQLPQQMWCVFCLKYNRAQWHCL